jgi:SAM-dependent methyltransferase
MIMEDYLHISQQVRETKKNLFYSLNGELTPQLLAKSPIFAKHNSLLDYEEDKISVLGPYDLILSYLALHYANDFIGALIQYKRLLSSKGVFLAVVFAGSTLIELKESLAAIEMELFNKVTPRVIPMIHNDNFVSLMQRAGHENPVVSAEKINMLYNNTQELFNDLRIAGQFNFLKERSNQYLGKTYFKHVEEYYKKNFSINGKLKATFEVIILSSNMID